MRGLCVAGCLAWGCLAKPGPPAGDPGADGSSGTPPCQAPSVRDAFDMAGTGCGSNFMTMGTGTATRDGATLELAVDSGQQITCRSNPFDISAGVFVEVPTVDLTP